MKKQSENEFTFKWIIKPFSMCHQPNKQFLRGPEFTSYYLPGMKWQIVLFPRGYRDEEHIALFLKRTDDIPELCNVNYTLQGLDCNEKSVFGPKVCSIVAEGGSTSGFQMRFKMDDLFRSLLNDILIIKLTLNLVCDSSDQEILPHLSYKNGLFTNFVLRANGEEFKVHKAILWARWRRLVENLDAEENTEQVFDVGSDVLEAILKYVYTGKLDSTESDLLAELYATAKKYELPILQSLPIVAQIAESRINAELLSLEWPIENLNSLPNNTELYCHSFSVDILKSCKWNLRLHVHEDAIHVHEDATHSCRLIDIFLCKIYDPETNPIFVRSKIFIGDSSFQNEHLFEKDKNWKCQSFTRVPVDRDGVLRLKLEFNFSDCSNFSEIMKSSYAYVSSVNCRSINNDFRNLYKTAVLSDINIIVGSKIFPAHKCVLCARSPVFSAMFQTDMIESENNSVEISDIEPQVMDEFLLFMYTGSFEKSLDERAEQLYVVANKYDVPVLKKKCSSFLKSNLNAKSMHSILELASLHSDDDLYKSMFRYSFAHAEEIFCTDEWKDIAEENSYIKLLQEMVVEGKRLK